MADKWSEPPDGSLFKSADIALSILLYFDSAEAARKASLLPGRLAAVLRANGARVDVLHRPVAFDRTLLDQYHEVWFLLLSADPADELTSDEAAALRAWMDRGGGVLIAGDHSTRLYRAGVLEYEGVGQAIGRRVPRARRMRLWDAPPDDTVDAFDTTDIALDRRNDPSAREKDANTQRLLIPLRDGEPHPIFVGPGTALLDRWPDHRHEGRVVEPGTADVPDAAPPYRDEWLGAQHGPKIVARSVDWRRGESHPVLAVWDGHSLPPADDGAPRSAGRIVADSSWHHYIDYNLDSIVAAGAGPDTDWAKIQALYVNLAAWLAPPEIRRRFRELACAWVSQQLDFEIKDLTDRRIGESTRRLLAARLPGAWRREIDRDMLAEAQEKADAAKMPREFVDVLMGAYMRRYVTGGKAPPVWRSKRRLANALAGDPDLLTEAIASYEDELWLREEQLAAFRATLP